MNEASNQIRTTRSRFEQDQIGGLKLTERDQRLLTDLYIHRAMSRSQLQALYFGSVARCNTRLRQLFDHGFVRRIFDNQAPYGTEAVYWVGRCAYPLLASRFGASQASVREQCHRAATPHFLAHTLASVDFYVSLRSSTASRSDTTLVNWLPESLCRHEYRYREVGDPRWRVAVFKPDAYFRIRLSGGLTADCFVEIDLGHTSAANFRGKLAMYERYFVTGTFELTYGSREAILLVVTTGTDRVRHLAEVSRRVSMPKIRFTTFTAIRSEGVFGLVNGSVMDEHIGHV
jgi:hypothetical protein